MGSWRNRQTRMLEGHVPERACWFDSSRAHLWGFVTNAFPRKPLHGRGFFCVPPLSLATLGRKRPGRRRPTLVVWSFSSDTLAVNPNIEKSLKLVGESSTLIG
jgi:hypothetical protein